MSIKRHNNTLSNYFCEEQRLSSASKNNTRKLTQNMLVASSYNEY